MLKIIGYHIFAFVYNLCRVFPIRKKQFFCITTHDDGEQSNVNLVVKAIRERGEGYTFVHVGKADISRGKGISRIGKMISLLIIKPYVMARSAVILMDNCFLPLSCFRLRKGVKAVQLWHGTGTIKKFGQDANTGRLKELERRANRNITHLIVNSERMKKIYGMAFGVEEQYIYPIGLPKTDEMMKRLDRVKGTGNNPDRERIFGKYKIPSDCILILYAPTFRDDKRELPQTKQLLLSIQSGLTRDYYLGLRLHPYVAGAYKDMTKGGPLPPRIIDFSYESDLTALLMSADILITDYSSIIFEYCLTERPMVFYAYDLEEFEGGGRGFYMDYICYVPGPVVKSGSEAAAVIKENRFDLDRIREFTKQQFLWLDKNATGRLLSLILDDK